MDYPETCFQIRLVSAFFVVALTFAGRKKDLKEDPIDASGFGDGLAFVLLVLIWSSPFLLADHSQLIMHGWEPPQTLRGGNFAAIFKCIKVTFLKRKLKIRGGNFLTWHYQGWKFRIHVRIVH